MGNETLYGLGMALLIIWQGSLDESPTVLIVLFLIVISPYGPFPWKRFKEVYFCFWTQINFKTKTKTMNTKFWGGLF